MPTADDDVVELFRDAYAALEERTPEAPTFEEIISRLPNAAMNGWPRGDAQPDHALDVADLRRSDVPTQPASTRRSTVIVLAVAAAFLLVVGIVVAGSERDSVVTEAASTPHADVPVAPAVPLEPDASLWSLLSFDEGEGFMGVVAAGPGFVAVGGEDGNAAVWTSPDGLTWSRVPHDEAVFGGRDFHEMNAVIAGGPGLVAVGMSADFGGAAALVEGQTAVDEGAVVWTSVDGLTWSRIPQDEAVFGGPGWQSMLDVTVGGPGLVAVGQDGGDQFWGNNLVDRPAVWVSQDGLTWSKVPDQDAFGSNSTMLGVTAGGPGLVAVGVGSVSASGVAQVWTSTDGLSWSRVTHDNPAEMRGFMWDVIIGGPGLIAVGCCEEPGQVWTSPDGLSWFRATDVSFVRPGH